MALSLWYRCKLTGISLHILEKRLNSYGLKIQNQYRRKKALKYVKRIRKAKAIATKRPKELTGFKKFKSTPNKSLNG